MAFDLTMRACWETQQGRACSVCDDWARQLKSLDLSPLAGFMRVGEKMEKHQFACGGRAGMYDCCKVCGMVPFLTAYLPRVVGEVPNAGFINERGECEMYGRPFDQEPEAPKPPEKSPADKALDEFIKRREAKREQHQPGTPSEAQMTADDRAFEQGQALGNAMSKLTHWEVSFRERLSPYRVVL